jgi:hypothetical protein
MKDVKANQLPADNNSDRATKVGISSLLLFFLMFSTPLVYCAHPEIYYMYQCFKEISEMSVVPRFTFITF